MENLPIRLFLFILPVIFTCRAADSLVVTKSQKEYLEMKGVIKTSKTSANGQEKVLDSALVRIYSDTTKPALISLYSDKKGKCSFRLPLNRKFHVTVSKKGYATKILEINTKVPGNKKLAYIFPFSVDLFEDIEGMDYSVLRKPIGKIAYYTSKEQFDYDVSYTNRVNGELKNVYKEYFMLMDTTQPKKPVVPVEKKPDEKKTGEKKKKG